MISRLSSRRAMIYIMRLPPALALMAVLLITMAACSEQSPNIGKYYKGRILHLSVAALERTDELRWWVPAPPQSQSGAAGAANAGEQFYRLTPEDADNELVILRVKVENHTATTAAINIDTESAQLRDFLQGRYFPIDVETRAEPVGIPEQYADRCNFPVNPEDPADCVRFLWNATYDETQPDGSVKPVRLAQELPRGTGLDGWLVFEVPKGAALRTFRWSAGDTISIDF